MILLLTIPREQESRFDTDRPYKERNEVNMIHLGDITKIRCGNQIFRLPESVGHTGPARIR